MSVKSVSIVWRQRIALCVGGWDGELSLGTLSLMPDVILYMYPRFLKSHGNRYCDHFRPSRLCFLRPNPTKFVELLAYINGACKSTYMLIHSRGFYGGINGYRRAGIRDHTGCGLHLGNSCFDFITVMNSQKLYS